MPYHVILGRYSANIVKIAFKPSRSSSTRTSSVKRGSLSARTSYVGLCSSWLTINSTKKAAPIKVLLVLGVRRSYWWKIYRFTIEDAPKNQSNASGAECRWGKHSFKCIKKAAQTSSWSAGCASRKCWLRSTRSTRRTACSRACWSWSKAETSFSKRTSSSKWRSGCSKTSSARAWSVILHQSRIPVECLQHSYQSQGGGEKRVWKRSAPTQQWNHKHWTLTNKLAEWALKASSHQLSAVPFLQLYPAEAGVRPGASSEAEGGNQRKVSVARPVV